MKVRLGWIISAVCLVSIAWMVVPRLTFWISAPTPSASEPARENQATPQATVETMFLMMNPTPEDPSAAPVVDRFNQFHLLAGEELTPEEQTFSGLFWDTRRSGILYAFMTDAMPESPSVTNQETNGDSATVTVSLLVSPPHTTESTSTVFTFDLKKRGPNWYVYELRVPKAPDGVFSRVKSNS
jgi:hypothetical protein